MQMWMTFYCSVKFRSCPGQGSSEPVTSIGAALGICHICPLLDGWSQMLCGNVLADMGSGRAVLQQKLPCDPSGHPNIACASRMQNSSKVTVGVISFLCAFLSPSLTVRRECDRPHYNVIQVQNTVMTFMPKPEVHEIDKVDSIQQ